MLDTLCLINGVYYTIVYCIYDFVFTLKCLFCYVYYAMIIM